MQILDPAKPKPILSVLVMFQQYNYCDLKISQKSVVAIVKVMKVINNYNCK
jgi:hypothetical protein